MDFTSGTSTLVSIESGASFWKNKLKPYIENLLIYEAVRYTLIECSNRSP